MVSCRNCDTQLEANYCPECGQKNIDLGRPLPELLGEVLRETFDVDGRAFRTIWTLFRWPGKLTSDFLAGKRRLYSPPFRLYLVISVLFFVVAGWVAGEGMLLVEGQTLETDAAGQARFVSDDLPRLMFVLLPVFALLLKAAFRKRLYFDHLIHALHLHSVAFLVMILLLPLEELADANWLALAAQMVFLLYLLVNFFVSLRRVYSVGWGQAIGKMLIVLLAYTMIIGITSDLVSHWTAPGTNSTPFHPG